MDKRLWSTNIWAERIYYKKNTRENRTFCNISPCYVGCNMFSPKKNANRFATSTAVVKPRKLNYKINTVH